jgi:hypothetical protein
VLCYAKDEGNECDKEDYCNAAGLCPDTFVPDETPCGLGVDPDDLRGPCDAGDKCEAGTCTDEQFKDDDVVCRPAVDCCDEPDKCPGNSYNCSSDLKYGPEVTCRTTCNDSPFDPEETCKHTDACPPNIILRETTCLTAGQHADAGTMSVIVSETALDTWTLCFSVSLADDWKLKGDESIKAHFGVDIPGSAPGQYDLKFPSGGISYNHLTDTYGACLDVSNMICPSDTLFFAVHLDVKNTATGETDTAWAMNECTSGAAMTTLPSSRFLNKKGNAHQGWGVYFMWEANCNDATCLNENCTGTNFPPAPTPPTPPPPTATPPTNSPPTSSPPDDTCDLICSSDGETTTVASFPTCGASLASEQVDSKKMKTKKMDNGKKKKKKGN